MSTIIIPFSKLYIGRQLAFRFLAILVGLSVLLKAGVGGVSFLIVLSLAFIGYPMRALLAKWKGKQPALLVSAEGFIDYTRPYQLGVITWEEVKEITIKRHLLFSVTKSVHLLLHDPALLVDRAPSWWHKMMMKRDIFWYKTPYCLDNRVLSMTAEDFLRLMQEINNGSYDFNNFGQHLIEQ